MAAGAADCSSMVSANHRTARWMIERIAKKKIYELIKSLSPIFSWLSHASKWL
jgi:hypothetical protein